MIDVAEEGIEEYLLVNPEEDFKEKIVGAVFRAVSSTGKLSLVACARKLGDSEPASSRGVILLGVLLVSPALDTANVDFEHVVQAITSVVSVARIPQQLVPHGLWWIPFETASQCVDSIGTINNDVAGRFF